MAILVTLLQIGLAFLGALSFNTKTFLANVLKVLLTLFHDFLFGGLAPQSILNRRGLPAI